MKVRIATRRSLLALTQTRWFGRQLQTARPDVEIELVEIVTTGDRIQDRPLRELGGKVLFVKEIEQALLDGAADIAVHSLKDLPTELPTGLEVLAVPAREDPRDVLVCADKSLDDWRQLPIGAVIATGSLRRGALLKRARPDVSIAPIRGNVDTRLRKLDENPGLDAVVLAQAGLNRLGVDVKRLPLPPDEIIPAAGQGALAIEAAQGRDDLAWIGKLMDDRETRLAVQTERAFLGRVGGSCQVPVGAYARWHGQSLSLDACVASEDGDMVRRTTALEFPLGLSHADAVERATKMGSALARAVLVAGGASVVASYLPEADRTQVARHRTGSVYLVGAGPGAAGLITVRGHRLLGAAGAIVYDYLANSDLLSLFNPGAEHHFVGKRSGHHIRTQTEICELLTALAHKHDIVVRLKGGDPFIFGRGGEEAAALRAADVPFEVVPGVTSAIAGPAYAGVPLTHRSLSRSVAFVTGHGADGDPGVNWNAAAGLDTLVILMGARRIRPNMEALMAAGRSADDPVLVVEWASFGRQRSLTTTVGRAASQMAEMAFDAPLVITVGAVVDLAAELSWFNNRPLFGKRVLVTRSRSQTSRLSTLLFQRGAVPVEVPSLTINAVEGSEAARLEATLRGLKDYRWVLFTSPNGVAHTFRRLGVLGLDARALAACKVATIGTATADVLRQQGIRADLIPGGRFDAEGLIADLLPQLSKGDRILVLRAREARPTLVNGLNAAGFTVDAVTTYATTAPADLAERLDAALSSNIDLLTFASSKTVRNLMSAASDEHRERLTAIPAACIGPVTRRAAESLGLTVVAQPSTYTIDALVEVIGDWCSL